MSYKIIVARYNENIEWLNSEISNCIIYNKGDKSGTDNEMFLENVGRESETYLHYIITNYFNLPDVVIFTQGKISDHGNVDINHLIKIKDQAFNHGKSVNFDVHHDVGKNIHADKTWNLRQDGYFLKDNYKNNNPITFIEWFKSNINSEYPDPIYIYWNAIFAVRKQKITNKPIEYYKRLINELKHNNNPTEGHFFERSWYYIFE